MKKDDDITKKVSSTPHEKLSEKIKRRIIAYALTFAAVALPTASFFTNKAKLSKQQTETSVSVPPQEQDTSVASFSQSAAEQKTVTTKNTSVNASDRTTKSNSEQSRIIKKAIKNPETVQAEQINTDTLLNRATDMLASENPDFQKVYTAIGAAVNKNPELASQGIDLVEQSMTKDSIDHLENAYTLLASIVQANPTAGNEAVGAVRSGLLTDKNDKVSVQMALISFVDIRMTQRQADERFETMHFSNTADNDKFLQELYAHGQVDRAEDVGPMLTDERCYKRSKDYLSEDILKKYGSSAYRFLQDNMQTRAYPGDEGNAQQYLDTLKAALAEKAPEELIQYVSTYSDMKNLSEEQKKQFVEEDQRMYKNWSEGHWVSDEQNADENLKQEWFRMEIMARRALSKASSAETNAAPADEQSAQKETINKAEKGQTSNLSPEAMKKISEAKTQRH